MEYQEFWVYYATQKYLDTQFPGEKNIPFLQLSVGAWVSQNPEKPSENGTVISRTADFPALTLEILQYLKKPASLECTYQIKLDKTASAQIGETGKKVLEEILALHNDFVTPKRR